MEMPRRRFPVALGLLAGMVLHPACSLRPQCKDSCYIKYLEGDDRSNCLSQCDMYHELQDRKEEEKREDEPIPELVIPSEE